MLRDFLIFIISCYLIYLVILRCIVLSPPLSQLVLFRLTLYCLFSSSLALSCITELYSHVDCVE